MNKRNLIALLILIFSIQIYGNSATTNTKQVAFKQDNYIQSNGFIIDGNSALQYYAQSGNGTSNNPYVIKDLQIADSTSKNGILVLNTNAYLVLRHVEFTSNGEQAISYNNTNYVAGLTLVNVSNIVITQCSFNDSTGLVNLNIENAYNVNVSFTALFSNYLQAFNVTQSTFSNNLVTEFTLTNSTQINVLNNTIHQGIGKSYVAFSHDTKLLFLNNTIAFSLRILITNTKDSIIENNFLNNGAYFDIENTFNSTVAKNIIANNQNASSIYVNNSYELLLSLNKLTHNLVNIQFVNSFNSSILNNIIEKEEFVIHINNIAHYSIGVELNNSYNNTINFNNISSIGFGIALQNSSCNDIKYNNIFNVSIGIQLLNSTTNFVIKNKINSAQKTPYADINGSFNLYDPITTQASPGWELISALMVLMYVSVWRIRKKYLYSSK